MSKKQSRVKHRKRRIQIGITDLLNLVDAIFIGLPPNDHMEAGWVEMLCNAGAREAINGIFPPAQIPWGKTQNPWFEAAPGWLACKIHLPEVAGECGAGNLPQHLLALRDLEDAQPDQLAMILAIATKDRGLRAAVIREVNGRPEIEIFTGHAGH